MLLFNGQPYHLSKADTEKYSKKMVFRVGLQFIKKNDIPDAPNPYWIGQVGIPTRHSFKMEKNGVVESGELLYYDYIKSKDERGNVDSEPTYIHIDSKGYIETKSSDAILNFFLDNHPLNERVKENLKHPNRKDDVETTFATYVVEKHVDRQMEQYIAINKITNALLERDEDNLHKMQRNDLVALAGQVAQSVERAGGLAGELTGYDRLEEKVLRERLLAIGSRLPVIVAESMTLATTDYRKLIEDARDKGCLIIEGEGWSLKKGNQRVEFMRVPINVDATEALVTFFSQHDTNGTKLKDLKDTVDRYNKAVDKSQKVKTVNT